ncbi:methyltransferase [Orbaceae bacterium ac157xtp]
MNNLKNNGFTFKRFFVAHDQCPMKVTTDSAILGAWATIEHKPTNVLDIGTGCGIIALMLAQRLALCEPHIDAIDIDKSAVTQCQFNFDHSPFHNLHALCSDINDFVKQTNKKYDLIVTNPPYFETAIACRNEQRQKGRYTENLNHHQLITVVTSLLKVDGRFCLVLPSHLVDDFCSLAKKDGLKLNAKLDVIYNATKSASLTLLCFSFFETQNIETQTLCMRDLVNNYTNEFRSLLKDFYLFRKK